MNRNFYCRVIIFSLLILVVGSKLFAQIPTVTAGTIERFEKFSSKYINARNIDVWIPEGYSNQKKYSVLYMHDGQMLFDKNLTWNKQSWDVATTISSLQKNNKIKDCIVVGIWNDGENRRTDYFPNKVFTSLSTSEIDSVKKQMIAGANKPKEFVPNSDNYLKFIVEELKPFIDKKYSVYTNQKNTFIAGSSMGGLISMYAICEYPKVFGGAACISTHWTGIFTLENNPIPDAFLKYLNKFLPNPKHHKIYFDCGDKTLDALYPAIQKKVDSLMLKKGYTKTNFLTKFFAGDDHSENSWSKRFNFPVEFLLKK